MNRRAIFGWIGGLIAVVVGSSRSAVARGQSPYPPPMAPEHRAEWDRLRALALAAIPYPRVEVPGDRALSEWERLRLENRGWPVIVGDDEQLDAIAEQFSIDDETVYGKAQSPGNGPAANALQTPTEILAEAAALDFPDSLTRWAGTDPDLPEPPLGEWPSQGTAEAATLTVANDAVSGKPFARVHILLIPTNNSW